MPLHRGRRSSSGDSEVKSFLTNAEVAQEHLRWAPETSAVPVEIFIKN
jgi:hypothetical protein